MSNCCCLPELRCIACSNTFEKTVARIRVALEKIEAEVAEPIDNADLIKELESYA